MKTRKQKQTETQTQTQKLSKRKISGGTTLREYWDDYQDVTRQNRKEDNDAFLTFLRHLFDN